MKIKLFLLFKRLLGKVKDDGSKMYDLEELAIILVKMMTRIMEDSNVEIGSNLL